MRDPIKTKLENLCEQKQINSYKYKSCVIDATGREVDRLEIEFPNGEKIKLTTFCSGFSEGSCLFLYNDDEELLMPELKFIDMPDFWSNSGLYMLYKGHFEYKKNNKTFKFAVGIADNCIEAGIVDKKNIDLNFYLNLIHKHLKDSLFELLDKNEEFRDSVIVFHPSDAMYMRRIIFLHDSIKVT